MLCERCVDSDSIRPFHGQDAEAAILLFGQELHQPRAEILVG